MNAVSILKKQSGRSWWAAFRFIANHRKHLRRVTADSGDGTLETRIVILDLDKVPIPFRNIWHPDPSLLEREDHLLAADMARVINGDTDYLVSLYKPKVSHVWVWWEYLGYIVVGIFSILSVVFSILSVVFTIAVFIALMFLMALLLTGGDRSKRA